MAEAKVLKEVIAEYCVFSGHSVNLEKSHCYFGDAVRPSHRTRVQRTLYVAGGDSLSNTWE